MKHGFVVSGFGRILTLTMDNPVTDRRTRGGMLETANRTERGIAIVFVLLAMMLLSALGVALALTTSSERQVSAAYGAGAEVFYAADAAFERAFQELSQVADWNAVLTGGMSTFVDTSNRQVLPDGSPLNLSQATDMVNCGVSPCSLAGMQATTASRPWAANNPIWQLYAFGPLSDLSPSGAIGADIYVVVWVGDDPLETDGQPLIDGDATDGPNPGAGLLQVLVHAYGRSGTRRVIEATLRREDSRTRVLSWREVRQLTQ
jgi:Tfp pilus assembly protein PilX